MADHAAVLAAVPLLTTVPADDLERWARQGVRRSYRRGQVLFAAGDPGDSLVVVLSGRVKVSVRSADGGELMLAVVPAGQSLGELGVIDGGVRSAEAETLEPTDVLVLSREMVVGLMAAHPSVAVSMMNAVAASLRRLTDVTADLVFLDLPRRVGKLLLEQAATADGWLSLGLSQEQVAHRVGGTRQSVNAALKGFERRGWIEVSGTRIRLDGRQQLLRFVGDDVSAR